MIFKFISSFFFIIISFLLSYAQKNIDTTAHRLDPVEIKAKQYNENVFKRETLSRFDLKTNTGKDLSQHLSSLAGVSVRKSGGNNNKPIIDGLSSSRILYMLNGVRIENQDWADAHSPEVAVDLAEHLSVIRGGESAKYGTNALGGVVLINTGDISDSTKINGRSSTFFDSNTKGIGGTIKLQQNLKAIKGLRWQILGNTNNQGDFHTADYNLGNTGLRQYSTIASINYIKGKFKIQSFYSWLYNKSGNSFSAMTGNIEEFEQTINLGRPLIILPFNKQIEAPSSEATHQVTDFKITWNILHNLQFFLQYTRQKNKRKEFEVRRKSRSSLPAQDVRLNSFQYRSEVKFFQGDFSSLLGIQSRLKLNANEAGTGVVPAIPNYTFLERSYYSINTLHLEKLHLNFGLRYDETILKARGYNFLSQYYAHNRKFQGISSQFALDYSHENFNILSSLNYSWRSPEVYELFSNGKQHGVPIFYIGDKDLDGERALKWMESIQYSTTKSDFVVQGFFQRINDYIYTLPTKNFKQLFSGPASIFQFKAIDAKIYGLDFVNKWHFTEAIEWKYQLSWIKGIGVKNKDLLPNISPLRFNSYLRYQFNSKQKKTPTIVQLEYEFVDKKRKFNPHYELLNKVPSAYHLFNFTFNTVYHIHTKYSLDFTLKIDNIFNVLYKDYLNLHRFFYHEKARNVKLILQFNF